MERRNTQRLKEQSEGGSVGAGGNGSRCRNKRSLQTGDIFITKHSNLADVHVIFHLIVDDSELRSGAYTLPGVPPLLFCF